MSSKIVKNTVEDYLDRYEAAVKALVSYLPWLEQHAEDGGSQDYKDSESTMAFPVYDSTLLAFIKQAQHTNMLDRNYAYVKTRRNLYTVQDEQNFIERAQLQDMDDLWGLLSGYVMEGMTRGSVWSDAVRHRIFYGVVKKMDELLILWSKEATATR